ncbi:LTA synthase family protein [Algoriphagus vanfongensis]|uniref:LTA synthase family protein n=1 Tax=Algoriphagus vanfongensis TaxID=426371 RepID=UPI000553F7E1|nr:LTA synthase family protein [Algoriphagus vanfongensis]
MAQKAAIRSTLPYRLRSLLGNFWGTALVFFIAMTLLRATELYLMYTYHTLNLDFRQVIWDSVLADVSWNFYLLGLIFIGYFFLSLISRKLSKIILQVLLTVLILIHLALMTYFFKTLLPLGDDLFAYSWQDLQITLQASGTWNIKTLIGALLAIGLFMFLFEVGTRIFRFSLTTYGVMTGVLIVGAIGFGIWDADSKSFSSEMEQNLELNKTRFLTEKSFDYLMYGGEYYFDFYLRTSHDDLLIQKEYVDDSYPFLHEANYPDVLSPYFDSLQQAPHLVFIFVESLGRAYSGKDAYLGSFTPFLDSLEQHSLVWLNAISSTGRTFGLQSGIFAGLPYGEKGFLELYQEFPNHKTLPAILGENGYEFRYFTGADKNFDHVSEFIEYQHPVAVVDEKNFDAKYSKAPSNSGNYTWGYGDKELFLNGMEKLAFPFTQPQIMAFQTQTSHDPYLVPQREYYEQKFDRHLEDYLGFSQSKITDYQAYKDIYMTVLYADDAVKDFIQAYKQRPEFANTIFIITGDHRLPEIPMSSRLDRFHVPLIVYSPLIKDPRYFRGMSSHFEITPSLLAFLDSQVGLDMPVESTWLGQVLDTAQNFQSKIAMPLMRNKNQLVDYIHGDLFYSDGQLYKISDNLNIDPLESPQDLNQLLGEFEDFKNKNNYMVQTRKLFPEE